MLIPLLKDNCEILKSKHKSAEVNINCKMEASLKEFKIPIIMC